MKGFMLGMCSSAPIIAKVVFVVVSIVFLLCMCFGLEFVVTVFDVICAVVLEVLSSAFMAWS